MNTHNYRAFQPRTDRGGSAPARSYAIPPMPGRILASDTILDGHREIGIEHAGSLYRLKLTRQGKLILNK